MNLFHAELLVVLAPALACLVLCGVANERALRSLFATRVKAPLLAVLASREHVNTLISVVTNLMFVGSGVGVLYGESGETSLNAQLGALLGLLCGIAITRLSRRAAALARKETDEAAQALRAAIGEALEAHCGDEGMPSQ